MIEPAIERFEEPNGDIHLILKNFAFGELYGYMPQVRLFTAIFDELNIFCLLKIQERLEEIIKARREEQDKITYAIINSNL